MITTSRRSRAHKSPATAGRVRALARASGTIRSASTRLDCTAPSHAPLLDLRPMPPTSEFRVQRRVPAADRGRMLGRAFRLMTRHCQVASPAYASDVHSCRCHHERDPGQLLTTSTPSTRPGRHVKRSLRHSRYRHPRDAVGWPEGKTGRRAPRRAEKRQAQREPHWNVTVLVPSALVTMLDVIACEPCFRQ